MLTIEQITGLDRSHLVAVTDVGGSYYLEAKTAAALQELRASANASGIEIAVASGYRDFERQKIIWDGKVLGERTLLDHESNMLDSSALSPSELVAAIMRWSAMPGASRHHWGSDFDIYDAQALTEGYQLQLVPEEYAVGGIFEDLTCWLDEQWSRGFYNDFYRPYDRDRGGVAPEPWHLSYRPVSVYCQQKLSLEVVARLLAQHDIALADYCLEHLDELYCRFITATA